MVQIVSWLLVVLAAVFNLAPAVYPGALGQATPALLVLIGLVPWVLLVLVFVSDGRYALFGPTWHSVDISAIVLPLVLVAGALFHFSMIDWRPPLAWALGMGMGYAALALMGEASARSARDYGMSVNRKRRWLVLPIAGVALGWAMLIEANGAIEPSAPAIQSVVIAGKWVSGGKSHTRYFTFVQTPVPDITNFEAPMDLYARSQEGDRVCLAIHTGLIGWRWYDLRGSYACTDGLWAPGPTRK